jgi:hypothetical protein
MEADAALGAVLVEIGGDLPKLNSHGNSFMRLFPFGSAQRAKQMNDISRSAQYLCG